MVTENERYDIETFSLTKIFPDWWGRAKVIAVDDLSLKIRHNEVYGLLGPNGSGKTTTLKILLSLLHPTKGRVRILGGSSRDAKVSARIGYLPEESYLYKYLSARETLEFYGKIFALPSRVRKSRIDALLEMVGLTGMANRPVGTYSKGMARRIGIAQALINDPEVLILDEPTSGMDPIGTRQMKDLIIKLAGRGKTVLLCSHLLADVEDVCDRIGILYGGRMRVEGAVGDLLKQSDRKQIVTTRISDDALAQIRRIVEAEDASCDVSSPMDKLEEFFVRTVAIAQQQHEPTSGAVNTGGISEFLAEDKAEEATVLDKLVSAAVSEEPEVSTDTSTTETVQTEEVEPVRDDVLGKLTGEQRAEPEEAEVTDTTKPVEVDGADQEKARDDVLNKLLETEAGSDITERTDHEKAGDSGDA